MMIKKKQKGFTLIELLIVVAIIAILAAVAIPQFAAYRMRGYNSAANSDIRNGGTAEEAIMADMVGYGMTPAAPAVLPGPGGTGVPAIDLAGPLAAATTTLTGGLITMGPTAPPAPAVPRPVVGVGLSLSNNVFLRAGSLNSIGIMAGYGSTFVMAGKHTFGDRAYAREAESTASFQCQNGGTTWVNAPTLGMVAVPAPTTGPDLAGVACGGVEIKVWTEM